MTDIWSTKFTDGDPEGERRLGYDGRFVCCPAENLPEKVLEILKQQPGFPFSVIMLAEMLGVSPFQIDVALEEIEGPIDEADAPGAYLYVARSSNQAIFIP